MNTLINNLQQVNANLLARHVSWQNFFGPTCVENSSADKSASVNSALDNIWK